MWLAFATPQFIRFINDTALESVPALRENDEPTALEEAAAMITDALFGVNAALAAACKK
jgi:hypothetical protein